MHRRKGMRGGGTTGKESRGAGGRGASEDVGLGRHDYVGVTNNKENGDIKIEDWSLPERPLIESGVGWYACACSCGCRAKPDWGIRRLWVVLVFRVWWQQRANCVG